jgi:glycosyltransferase involved in cell wall biosynthesis
VKDPGTVGFILNGLVSRFGILPSDEIRLRLEAAGQPFFDKPFLLHVGSDTKRKNRQVALQVFLKIKDKWAGNIVFAGAPIDKEMALLVQESNISCRVIEVISPDDGLLEALYNKAFALLFPSRFEGFGFPIIEAQACGCPVLCSSDCAPFSEIVRDSAIMKLSHDVDGFAAAIIRLSQDTSARQGLVSKGLENSKRFATDRMINEYVSLYKRLLGGDKDALP